MKKYYLQNYDFKRNSFLSVSQARDRDRDVEDAYIWEICLHDQCSVSFQRILSLTPHLLGFFKWIISIKTLHYQPISSWSHGRIILTCASGKQWKSLLSKHPFLHCSLTILTQNTRVGFKSRFAFLLQFSLFPFHFIFPFLLDWKLQVLWCGQVYCGNMIIFIFGHQPFVF